MKRLRLSVILVLAVLVVLVGFQLNKVQSNLTKLQRDLTGVSEKLNGIESNFVGLRLGPLSASASKADCDDTVDALKILDSSYPRELNDIDLLNAAIMGMAKKIDDSGYGSVSLAAIPPGTAFNEAIAKYYSDETEATRITKGRLAKCDIAYAAVSAMLRSLHDSHTVFLNPKIVKAEKKFNSGVIEGGVGVSLMYLSGSIYIDDMVPRGPAEKAGLNKFDKILKVNGWSYVGISRNEAVKEVVKHILGPIGSSVTITIKRPGIPEPLSFTVARARVNYPFVEYRMINSSVGYIKIRSFESGVFKTFLAALEGMLNNGAKSLVIDLRDDPGGSLDEVSGIISVILAPHATVYRLTYRFFGIKSVVFRTNPGIEINYTSKAVDNFNIPIAVLINNGSASASEVLSSAIKEHNRGITVGERTRGALEVARIADFSDGSEMEHTVYFMDMLMANGKFAPIEGVGVAPTIPVALRGSDLARGVDSQLDAAVKYLEKLYK